MTDTLSNLSVHNLHTGYKTGEVTPVDTVEHVLEKVHSDESNTWISFVEADGLRDTAERLTAELHDDVDLEDNPLFGIPFGVKDNIDCKGQPTTAACTNYEYTAEENAPVLQKLLDAGGILIGKTNLDQFATGVVGTRSPYGACKNAINREYISGGSSSGSAVAVASNQVTFTLGTDTGGSGRVPAACNGIIGLKPSRGVLSKSGVVPACKSLDCVSVFATSALDALLVEKVAAGFDPDDEYSDREADEISLHPPEDSTPVLGLPDPNQLEFFSDAESRELFNQSIHSIEEAGFDTHEYDISPFLKCSSLLFDGPWVVERREAIKNRVSDYPDDLLNITREVLSAADEFTAEDVFTAEHKKKRLLQKATETFESVDYIVVPTIGTIYTIDEVEEDPIETNSNLGLYTNFVNLFDLSAVTIPAGRRDSGLPFSVTLIGEKYQERYLATVADKICTTTEATIGNQIDYVDLDSPWPAVDSIE